MPRIAVDLRIADAPGMEHTGVGRYALETARALGAARPTWELALHSNRPEVVPGALRTRWPTASAWGRIGWLHAGAALTARDADLWFGAAFALPAWWRGPAAVTVHDLTFMLMPERYRGWLNARHAAWTTRRSARRADRVLCGSAYTRDLLVQRLGVSAERVAVTPYGVAQAFRVATDVAREDFVLFAGVLEARKGIDVLHEAVRRAGLRLVLAGRPGWGIDQELAAVRGDPAVELVVGPSDARLADLYARALVLAYPSRMEGFGLPVAEAMAAGCPVVCSDLPAIREWAADAPLYVAPGDPGSLAAALECVARDGA